MNNQKEKDIITNQSQVPILENIESETIRENNNEDPAEIEINFKSSHNNNNNNNNDSLDEKHKDGIDEEGGIKFEKRSFLGGKKGDANHKFKNSTLHMESRILNKGIATDMDNQESYNFDQDQIDEIRTTSKLGQQAIQKIQSKRRKCRIISFLVMVLLILGVCIGVAFAVMLRGTINLNTNHQIEMTIQNCKLFILDPTKDNKDFSIKYNIPSQGLNSEVSRLTQNSVEKLSFLNEDNQKDICEIKLYLGTTSTLQKLTLECMNCDVIQSSSNFRIQSQFSINGNITHLNFKNLEVGSIDVKGFGMVLQLNQIKLNDNSIQSTVNAQNTSEIILQSISNIEIEHEVASQVFCFSAPYVQEVSSSNCYISGQSATKTLENNTQCTGKYNLCASSSDCSISQRIKVVTSQKGSLYANKISELSEVAQDTNEIQKGGIFDSGIRLNEETSTEIENFNVNVETKTISDPVLILDLGSFQSHSSKSAKFILTSNQAYLYTRPWWFSTVTISLASPNLTQVSANLHPGVCPFRYEWTQLDLFSIQQQIRQKIKFPNPGLVYVSEQSLGLAPETPRSSEGLFKFSTTKLPAIDKWYDIEQLENGSIFFNSRELNQNALGILAVVMSLLISCYIGVALTKITINGLNSMYYKIIGQKYHVNNYSRLEKTKIHDLLNEEEERMYNRKIEEKLKLQPMSLISFLEVGNSPLAYLDMYTVIIRHFFSNSLEQYYDILFEKIESSKQEIYAPLPENDLLRGSEVKYLYERFCFLNNSVEKKLTLPDNLNILKKFGFQIIAKDDLLTEVFVRVKVKDNEDLKINISKDQKADSLDMFIKYNIEKTPFNEDQIEVSDFIKLYHKFCNFNRLQKKVVSLSLMEEKYGIETDSISQQFLVRKEKAELKLSQNESMPKEWFKNLRNRLDQESQKRQAFYIINTENVHNYFKVITGKIDNLSQEQIQKSTKQWLQKPKWYIWDFFSILFSFSFYFATGFPLIALCFLLEDSYSDYSLKEKAILITWEEFTFNPFKALEKMLLDSFGWDAFITWFVLFYWGFSMVDTLIYTIFLKVPVTINYKKIQEMGNSILKFFRIMIWIMLFLIITSYFAFFTLWVQWAIFSAILNPSAYLPLASLAATFAIVIRVQYQNLVQLRIKGSKAIFEYVNNKTKTNINETSKKLIESFESANKDAVYKMNTNAEQEFFKALTNKIIESANEGFQAARVAENDKVLLQENGNKVGDEIKNDSNGINAATIVGKTSKVSQVLKNRVREECIKRNIPPIIADAVISSTSNDFEQLRKDTQRLLDGLNRYRDQDIQLFLDIVFTDHKNGAENIKYLSQRVIELIVQTNSLDEKLEIQPHIFFLIIKAFRDLKENQYEHFTGNFRKLISSIEPKDKVKRIEQYFPVIELTSIIASQNVALWKLEQPLIQLMRNLSEEKSSKDGSLIRRLVQYFSIIFESFRDFKDVDNPNIILDPKAVLSNTKKLCNSIGVISQSSPSTLKRLIPDMIFLSVYMARRETMNLPNEFLKDMEAVLQLQKLGKNNILRYFFKLLSVISLEPSTILKKIQWSSEEFAIEKQMADFITFVLIHPYSELEKYTEFASKHINNPITKNYYINILAEKMKLNPRELLGLINILHGKYNTPFIKDLLEGIMSRMEISLDKLPQLQLFINIFLSNDENVLLNSAKQLGIGFYHFLLMSKGIFNPRFIPKREFDDLQINPQIIEKKDDIYYEVDESYEFWKQEIKRNIDTNKKKANDPYQKKKFNLIYHLMTRWDLVQISKKKVYDIVDAFDNNKNSLKKSFTQTSENSENDCVDLLQQFLTIRDIQVVEGRRHDTWSKEKELIVTTLAEILNVDEDDLEQLIKLLVIKDPVEIRDSICYFFEDQRSEKEAIKEMLEFCTNQINQFKEQLDFIYNDLPEAIQFQDDEDFVFPEGFIRKLFFDEDWPLTLNHALEFANIFIHKLKIDQTRKESLLTNFLEIFLFVKGLYSETKSLKLGIKNDIFLQIFNVFSIPDFGQRIAEIIDLIHIKDHPVKIALSLYAVLKGLKLKIAPSEFHHQSSKSSGKEGASGDKGQQMIEVQHHLHHHHLGHHNLSGHQRGKEEDIRVYLASIFKLYPEAFDIFDAILESDVQVFAQKISPIYRRVNKSSLVDENLLDTVFALVHKKHFDTTYLSNKLDIDADILTSIVHLVRMMDPKIREVEVQEAQESIEFKNTMDKLNIKTDELIAILSLIYDYYKSDGDLAKILRDLHLIQKVDLKVFCGLVHVSKPIDREITAIDYFSQLDLLKSQTKSFFQDIQMDENLAFIISRIAAGNFLVLMNTQRYFEWIYPKNNLKCEEALKNMIMGLCGILNPLVEIEDDIYVSVQSYIIKHYPQDDFTINLISPMPNKKETVQPKNSISFAIFLLYQTIDMPPCWMQAFLFDINIFEKTKTVKPELLLTIVLNFVNIVESARDVLTTFEWLFNLGSDDFAYQDSIEHWFSQKFNFDPDQLEVHAKQLGILNEDYWVNIFSDKDKFYVQVNKQITEIIMDKIGKSRNEVAQFKNKSKEKLSQPPQDFLDYILTEFDIPTSKKGRFMYGIVEYINKIFLREHQIKERVEGYLLNNLCSFGIISNLRRDSSHYDYTRVLYNLNQLVMNIEKKMLFDDFIYFLSKIRTIKLIAISLGKPISNVVEWCLPPSLFERGYINKLSTAEDRTVLKSVKEEMRLKLINDKKYQENWVDPRIFDHTNELIEADDWDFIFNFYNLSDGYLGNLKTPQFFGKQDDDQNELYKKCKNSQFVYKSKEILELIYNHKGKVNKIDPIEKEYMKQRLEKKYQSFRPRDLMNDEDEENQTEDFYSDAGFLQEYFIDLRSGLTYDKLSRKSRQFEEVLFHQDMKMIVKVAQGKTSTLLKANRLIQKNQDSEQEKNDIVQLQQPDDQADHSLRLFNSLLGLHTLRSRNKIDKKTLKNLLDNLEDYLKSDVSMLLDLLTAIVTESDDFDDIMEELEISERDSRLLFISKHKHRDYSQIIAATLDLGTLERENLLLLLDVYRLKEDAWNKLWKKLAISKAGKNSPLNKLIKKIDFTTISQHRNSKKTIDASFTEFFKLPEGEKSHDHIYLYILNEIVLKLDLSNEVKDIVKQPEVLKDTLFSLLDLAKLDIASLVDRIIMPDYPEENSQKSKNKESHMERIFNVLRLSSKDHLVRDLSILRIFLVLYLEDYENLKSSQTAYSKVRQQVIEDMINLNLLNLDGLKHETKSKMIQMVLGILAFDFQEVIESFTNHITYKESCLFQSLYVIFNLSKFINIHGENSKVIQNSIQMCLHFVGKGLTSKSTFGNQKFFISDFEILVERLYGVKTSQEAMMTTLNNELQNIFMTIDKFNANKKANLIQPNQKGMLSYDQILIASLSKNQGQKLSQNQPNIYQIVSSILNGDIFILLINTFINDEKQKNFIQSFILISLQAIQKCIDEKENPEIDKDILETGAELIYSLTGFDKDGILQNFLDVLPRILTLFLKMKTDYSDNETIKREVLLNLIDVIGLIKNKDQQQVMIEVMSSIIGINLKKLKKDEMRYDMGFTEKFNAFFKSVMPRLFKDFDTYLSIVDVTTLIEITNHLQKLQKNPQDSNGSPLNQRFEVDSYRNQQIIQHVLPGLNHFKIIDLDISQSIIALIQGNFWETSPLLKAFIKEDHKYDRVQSFLFDIKNLLEFKAIAQGSNEEVDKNARRIKRIFNDEDWKDVMRKVKKEKADAQDLFEVVDQIGEASGTITSDEFITLTKRLGMQMTKHRFQEIFSKVKGQTAKVDDDIELDNEEFEEALDYLDQRNCNLAEFILKFTPEKLTVEFIKIILVLIFILSLAYIGMRAFSIASDFSAVINSLIIMGVGYLLNQRKETKEKLKLEDDSIKKASNKAIKIIQSLEL